MSKFVPVQCSKCGGPVEGLQLTEEQRLWLDVIKDAVIAHMQNIEHTKAESGGLSLDDQGWLAIAEPYLFLYGYMISREDKKQ